MQTGQRFVLITASVIHLTKNGWRRVKSEVKMEKNEPITENMATHTCSYVVACVCQARPTMQRIGIS